MKRKISIALAAIPLVVFAAPDKAACDRLLKNASELEYSARRAYLLSDSRRSVTAMEKAAEAFERYASGCNPDKSISFLGVLVHGRLSITYKKLGRAAESQQSANLAIKYGSIRAKKQLMWPDVEVIIANADAKQKEALK